MLAYEFVIPTNPATIVSISASALKMRITNTQGSDSTANARASAVCGSCSAALADAPRFDVTLAKYATMANDTIKAADAPYAYIQNGTGRL